MKKVAILQSNYIPWKGYFDIIASVDLFIFHDDLQYTKGDWRNRNKIKTSKGSEWLTVPCGTDENRLICEVALNDPSWQKKHWQKICANYLKAPYFKKYENFVAGFYLEKAWSNLSDMNQFIIRKIATETLGIKTQFDDSRRYGLTSQKANRVLDLLQKSGAGYYLSGPAAKTYLSESACEEIGVRLIWMDYSRYPEYPQLWGEFTHEVSIIDMLFNCGDKISEYMRPIHI